MVYFLRFFLARPLVGERLPLGHRTSLSLRKDGYGHLVTDRSRQLSGFSVSLIERSVFILTNPAKT